MKYIKLLFVSVVFLFATACSGSSSYSPEKCKALAEKIDNGEKLTEDDYTVMINQFGAAAKALNEKQQAIEGDKEAEKEFRNSEEGKDMFGVVLGFGIYLETHKRDLTPAHQKQLDKIQKEMDELNANN